MASTRAEGRVLCSWVSEPRRFVFAVLSVIEMIEHRLQGIVVCLTQVVLPGNGNHGSHLCNITPFCSLRDRRNWYIRQCAFIVVLPKKSASSNPLSPGHRVVPLLPASISGNDSLTQQRVGHARPFGHLLFHGRMDPQCVHDCPFVDLRPEILQQTTKSILQNDFSRCVSTFFIVLITKFKWSFGWTKSNASSKSFRSMMNSCTSQRSTDSSIPTSSPYPYRCGSRK